ncbi:Histidine kinase [Pedobacter terrae]|uniref:Histidine kinase n=1 Tax=Pedobacter terrae TaxID=405671 RepID=A0A1G8EJW1_9SPHI|nr:sensor histidine kinase [Pedobacter terrae]SDH70168.1 Histidine kinase [Pedobacter terrae]
MKKLYLFCREYKLHIFLWLIFITYESVVAGIFSGEFGPIENYVVHYTLNISLFYINYFFIITISDDKTPNIWLLLIVISTEILLYIPLLAFLNQLFTSYNKPTPSSILGINYKFIVGAIYRSVFFIMVSTGYAFLIRFYNERRRLQQMEIAHLKEVIERRNIEKNLVAAKNAFIRAQLNPHLLFNVLNFIHNRVRKIDHIAGDLVISLVDVMRYAINTEYNEGVVSLKEEIEYLETLLNIFEEIKGKQFNLDFSYPDDIDSIKIIPLLLLTIAENMFKHGDLTDPTRPAFLNISTTKLNLEITAGNNLLERPIADINRKGLLFLQERIKEAYGNNGYIEYKLIDEKFIIKILIPLTPVHLK